MSEAYIVLMEEGQVADDSDPDKQCRGAQEDAADVIACQVLGAGIASTPSGPSLGMASAGSGRGGQGLEGDGVGRQGSGRTHLGFNANLHDGARDGEHVAGDQQDVPAIDKFQPLPQANDPSPPSPHEPDKFLQR